ncbi:VOC family protein [Candidatus Beckwithbacteria bacterium]|nr:VOC family protein [Candidatus Beckwithbacteria bacterium]
MIIDNYQNFLDQIFQQIKKNKIDVSALQLDHLGYQASSDKDYDRLKPEFLEFAKLKKESLVGERRVGIFELNSSLFYQNYKICAIELIAPKKEQKCDSSFEHAEFVIKESFEDFIKKYPQIDWNIEAMKRDIYAKVQLKLPNGLGVKFHRASILQEI